MTACENQMKSSRRRGQRRTLAFHLATVVVVLCPLALGELALRWCVPAPQMRWQDPFVSFSGQRPLFVLNEKGDRFETSAERLDAFRPQSFAVAKSPVNGSSGLPLG